MHNAYHVCCMHVWMSRDIHINSESVCVHHMKCNCMMSISYVLYHWVITLIWMSHHMYITTESSGVYGVPSSSRLLTILGLVCRILSLSQGSFAKQTYNFKAPTTQSHTIPYKTLLGCGFSSMCPVFFLICTINSKVKSVSYVYQEHVSRGRCADLHWTGSTPAGFPEAFRAVIWYVYHAKCVSYVFHDWVMSHIWMSHNMCITRVCVCVSHDMCIT